MEKQNYYGSIPAADEETALIARVENDMSHTDEETELYVAQRPPKYGKGLLMTLVAVAVFAVLAFSNVSPVSAMAKSSGDGGGAGAPPFDWKEYGHNIKAFWADQKAKWAEKKAEMTANNATMAEQKESKKSFWNSTMPEFSDALNTTKAAERQQTEAETTANQAAIAEAMAEVEAQRSKGSK